jgi:hypothetical protein
VRGQERHKANRHHNCYEDLEPAHLKKTSHHPNYTERLIAESVRPGSPNLTHANNMRN